MKLLFDENLSARLTALLAEAYPGSAHVGSLGLAGARDRALWARAAADGYVLVTKDEDFHRLSVLLGPPPKVVWCASGTAPRRTSRGCSSPGASSSSSSSRTRRRPSSRSADRATRGAGERGVGA